MDKFSEGFMDVMYTKGIPAVKAAGMLKLAIFANKVQTSPAFADGVTSVLQPAKAAIQKSDTASKTNAQPVV